MIVIHYVLIVIFSFPPPLLFLVCGVFEDFELKTKSFSEYEHVL